MKKVKGFTLVELAVSLALTAVIIDSIGTFLYFSLQMDGFLRRQDQHYDAASDIARMIKEYANSESEKSYDDVALDTNQALLFTTPDEYYVYDNENSDLLRVQDEMSTTLYNGIDGYVVTPSYDESRSMVEYTISYVSDPILVFSVFLG